MRVAALVIATLGIGCTAAAPALAGPFGPGATLASVHWDRLEQGDDSTIATTISGDGRYVVFDTRAGNFYPDDDFDPPGTIRRGGVFRYDIQTRVIVPVADGDYLNENDPSVVLRRGAHNASVSTDGRYIAFSTAQQIVSADTNDHVDVYVRDMDGPKASPSSYELVSARDGSTAPAGYAAPASPIAGRNPGAEVFSGHSISSDGRRVVFRTAEASDLPAQPLATVPRGQVFVRDLDAHTTILVTRDKDTLAPAGGGEAAIAISGDGTTIAWVGQNAQAQTRFVNGETTASDYYLWRRVADGPSAPTRRITGLADPDDPGCTPAYDALNPIGPSPTSTDNPCYGPLTTPEKGFIDISQRAPALSHDGYEVAFLASAGLRPQATNNPGPDLFITSMRPGVTRKAGTTELTRDTVDGVFATAATIDSVSMSQDGRYLAIATNRVRFSLPTLAPAGPPFRSQPDAREIYVIDLTGRTIERAVRSNLGGDAASDVGLNPALTDDGSMLAFTSNAGNLFFGDSNERGDAFFTKRSAGTGDGGVPPVDAPAFVTVTDEPDDAGATAKRLKDGRLQVSWSLPGPGKVTVFARTRGANQRTVARVSKTVGDSGTLKVNLSLKGKERARVSKGKSLSVSIRLRFVPDTGPALTELINAKFAKASVSSKSKKRLR